MKIKFILLFIIFFLLGCEVGVHVCATRPGIYELKSETFPNAQTYRFDSTAKDNILFCGTNEIALEFTDLTTGKRIKLEENNMRYRGKLILLKETCK